MNEYFPEPKSLGGRVKVESDLSNHGTKPDLKKVTGADKSKFAIKVDLAHLTNLSNLKSKVDKLDADKSVAVPVDLSKVSDVVKNDVVKKMLLLR